MSSFDIEGIDYDGLYYCVGIVKTISQPHLLPGFIILAVMGCEISRWLNRSYLDGFSGKQADRIGLNLHSFLT